MGVWQLASVTNILGRPVMSVYPSYGGKPVWSQLYSKKKECTSWGPTHLVIIYGSCKPLGTYHSVVLLPVTSGVDKLVSCFLALVSKNNSFKDFSYPGVIFENLLQLNGNDVTELMILKALSRMKQKKG